MWGKGAIAFAMWQGSEAWELAHISLTQLTHNYEVVAPFHTTHNHTNTKKRITFRLSFLAVRRGLEPLTPCVTGTYSNQLN